jgi:L-iditol 2-dehydrogenase
MSDLPSHGRAAVLEEYGADLVIRDLPLPDPEEGALVVEIELATVCGSDVHLWDGGLEGGAYPINLPLNPGHEMVGKIVAFGPQSGVDSAGTELALGDRVVWTHESCGHCEMCTLAGLPNICTNRRVGMLMNCEQPPYFTGTFGEYGYVWPHAGRIRVPDDVPSEWAAAASCAGRTTTAAFERAGEIDYRHTVLIQGAGPLGLYGVALAKSHNPHKVIVVGGPDNRLEIAKAFGADAMISVDEYRDSDARVERLMEETDGHGADVLFDLAGAPGAFAEGVRMAARGARYVAVGTLTPGTQPVEVHRIIDHCLTIIGSYSGVEGDYWKAMEFMRASRDSVDWDRLFGGRYGLDEVTDALRNMQAQTELKPVIVPGKS